MSKLLKANFRRLFRSRVYWLSLAVMLFLNFYPMFAYRGQFVLHQNFNYDGEPAGWCGWTLFDMETYASNLFYISYFVMVIVSVFIGEEYSSGAIRNKIIAGNSRTRLYISYFITSYAGIMLITLVTEAISLGVSLLLYCKDITENYKVIYSGLRIGDYRDVIKSDLTFVTNINIGAVVGSAALVSLVIICMTLIGRKAPGFITVLLLDAVSNMYIWEKYNDMMNAYSGYDHERLKAMAVISFDPNGYMYTSGSYEEFPMCTVCCMVTVAAAFVVGIIIMNKKDIK